MPSPLEGRSVALGVSGSIAAYKAVDLASKLTQAGAEVEHIFVLFYYDIFPESARIIAETGVTMHALATWWDVLRVARDGGHFDAGVLDEVESYLKDPNGWSPAHGGFASEVG